MNKYLVVEYNRYETKFSSQRFVDSESSLGAILGESTDVEEREWIESEIVHKDEIFSFISGEEFDTLVYKIN
jgi:hypothetical protein